MGHRSKIGMGAIAATLLCAAGCDTPEPSVELTLASTPLHMIIIEDEGGSDGLAWDIDGLDPSMEVWSQSAVEMIIEDEPDHTEVDRLAFQDTTRRFMLALAGTAGAAASAANIVAPTTAEPAPRARREAVPTSRQSSSAAASQGEVAVLAAPSAPGRVAPARLASLGKMDKAMVRPRAALEPHEIRQTIVRQLPKVKACYERALKAEGGLRGRLVLSLDVQPEGNVTGARISDDGIGNDTLSACVVKAVDSWRFPAGTETVSVEYPVSLKPSSGTW